MIRTTLAIVALLLAPALHAGEVYTTPEEFIAGSFERPPEPDTFWLTGNLAESVNDILGHDYHKLRIRYWRRDQRTAWVLEEIGKERYITAGFVVESGKLRQTKVLIFRESRGWEIRHDFFTDQFEGARLDNGKRLDRKIDNITGATLSVRAMERLARLALFLHEHVTSDDAQ